MSLPVMSDAYLAQLKEFERKILLNQTKIEAWFRQQWCAHKPPFYGSVDIRNAGYKMASIDMNLFPGGFNNLNPNFIQLAADLGGGAVIQLPGQHHGHAAVHFLDILHENEPPCVLSCVGFV